ncbi:LUD domain-containing protein [Natrarchaeobaculum aegyptiacum]|uniref:LUD domain-containing protein n=1 Tax=Natrarchaeobaculum aegyptiacum TaxID=745377 RepID=A0A2Z2HUZ7_9EURY|nr:LUD domain-containing protein [Natrarchaeobaculum aegyptiacum]ARS91021.1 hypothetical protein B1756_15630 [Natrarchaeobaculum aegyptiacum]
MTSAAVETFERSLENLPVTFERVDSGEFRSAVESRIDPPAVGVSLPFDGVSLEDTSVNLNPTSEDVLEARTGVTPGGPSIAEFGTVVVASAFDGASYASLFPETHVVVVAASEIVETIDDALETLAGEIDGGLTSAILTTGPSATADMGAPVYGAHGPESLHVIILGDR